MAETSMHVAVSQSAESPFTIEYSPAVLEAIRGEVEEALYAVPRGGAETGGVLFGRYQDGRVRIMAARSLLCEHAFGPSFALSPQDHQQFAALLRTPQLDTSIAGLQPVGWYRSHTRTELLLSPEDAAIHKQYFPQEWQVALLLKPASFRPTRAGFFFRDGAGTLRTGACHNEFLLEPLSRVGAPHHGEQVAVPTVTPSPAALVPAAPTSAAAAEPKLAPIVPPTFLAPKPKRSFGPWLAGTMLALLVGAGFETRSSWLGLITAIAAPQVALQVSDAGGQTQIRWHPGAVPVRGAHSATLRIEGGPSPLSVALDRRQLEAGAFGYVRQSERITVTLLLQQPDGSSVQESASLSAPLPPRQPTLQEIDAVRERDELAKEAEQMRKDLKTQQMRTRRLEKAVEKLQQNPAAPTQ